MAKTSKNVQIKAGALFVSMHGKNQAEVKIFFSENVDFFLCVCLCVFVIIEHHFSVSEELYDQHNYEFTLQFRMKKFMLDKIT